MNRLLLAPALALAVLIGAWATAPIAGTLGAILFGGLAEGLRGALWAAGCGVGVGVGVSLPLWTVGRLLTGRQAPTALPRPASRWETGQGHALPSGDIEAEWHEIGED